MRRSAKTTKKGEAQIYLQRLLEEHAGRARGDLPRHTFADAVERFFQETRVKPATLRSYKSNSRTLGPTFDALYLDQVTKRTIAEFVSTRKKARVTDTTIRRDLAFLSVVCTAAQRWSWLDTNPVTTSGGKRGLRESRPRTRFLSHAEFERLVAAASPSLRPAIILAVETGMRREELFGLTINAIDLNRREVHLEKTKTSAPRRLPLSDKAIVAIRNLLDAPDRPRSAYLLCKDNGSRFGDMKKGFAAACRRAKIENMRWHDLRHTFASWFVQRGGDLYKLSRILGHTGLQMTSRYGHLRVEDLHNEIEKVAQYRPQERLIDLHATAGSTVQQEHREPENPR
ncbi:MULTISPECIES: site-specific integrase [unclassified Methylobacterium]|uniref:tyrosine-type recombinase/integrase n=1 Tax=unclassified Methylobacterium TaxID=2615210 RepID=UPI002269D239